MQQLRLMKDWFAKAEVPTEEARAEAVDTHVARQPDPFSLRSTHLPKLGLIWEANNHKDLYTNHAESWYTEHQPKKIDRDHVLEVQTASIAAEMAAIDLIEDEAVIDTTRSYLNSISNLNNTDPSLNQWWKGVAVTEFNTRYRRSKHSNMPMRAEVDGLAPILRDKMRSAIRREVGWLDRSEVCTGWRAELLPTSGFVVIDEPTPMAEGYAPNWTRNIDREMGASIHRFIGTLDEEGNGQGAFERWAEETRQVLIKMDLSGSP